MADNVRPPADRPPLLHSARRPRAPPRVQVAQRRHRGFRGEKIAGREEERLKESLLKSFCPPGLRRLSLVVLRDPPVRRAHQRGDRVGGPEVDVEAA